MKKLLNVTGAKALNKSEQKAIQGGSPLTDCISGGGTYKCTRNPHTQKLHCWCDCPNHDGNGGGTIIPTH